MSGFRFRLGAARSVSPTGFSLSACMALSVMMALGCGPVNTGSFTISGTLSGLPASTSIVLQLNGGADLTLDSDGPFTFSSTLGNRAMFQVLVLTQPSATVSCNVYDGFGTIPGANVTTVEVKCYAGLYNVVDTGQTDCYDASTGAGELCVGVGYDADYLGRAPSYTVSSDGAMVYDEVTGLIWTRSPDTNLDGFVNALDKLEQPESIGSIGHPNAYGNIVSRKHQRVQPRDLSIAFGPRTSTSPASPSAGAAPSSRRTGICTPHTARPTEPGPGRRAGHRSARTSPRSTRSPAARSIQAPPRRVGAGRRRAEPRRSSTTAGEAMRT